MLAKRDQNARAVFVSIVGREVEGLTTNIMQSNCLSAWRVYHLSFILGDLQLTFCSPPEKVIAYPHEEEIAYYWSWGDWRSTFCSLCEKAIAYPCEGDNHLSLIPGVNDRYFVVCMKRRLSVQVKRRSFIIDPGGLRTVQPQYLRATHGVAASPNKVLRRDW